MPGPPGSTPDAARLPRPPWGERDPDPHLGESAQTGVDGICGATQGEGKLATGQVAMCQQVLVFIGEPPRAVVLREVSG